MIVHFFKRCISSYLIVLILLWILFGYIFFPALRTVEVSLFSDNVFSTSHYVDLLLNPTSRIPLFNSIVLGLLTVLICGIVGTLLAFFVHFFDFPLRKTIDKLLIIPIMLPGIIIVFSFVQLYGESGLITKSIEYIFNLENPPFRLTGLPGILFIHAYTQYVYFYITISIAIKHIDLSVLESSRNLGASKRKVFTSIILPFLAPALISASVITFMSGIGSFTAPSIVGGGYKVLTTQILLSKTNNYMSIAATQVIVLTLISLALFFIFRIYEKKMHFSSSIKGVPIQPTTIQNKTVRFIVMLVFFLLVGSILLPLLAIFLISFVPSGSLMVSYFPQEFSLQNYVDIFMHPRKYSPFLHSIIMALLAALFGIFIAVPASFLLIKKISRLNWLIDFLIMLPWAMPSSAIAINIINAFNKPTIFSFNQILVGSAILLPIGYCIRTLPIVVKTLNVSFQNVNQSYLEASYSLGGSKFVSFRKVIIPMISSGLIAGFLIMFIRSIGEYTISVFLYNASNKPISIAMINAIFEYNIGLAMTYGSLLILLSILLSFLLSKITLKLY